jgi:hypothetical protein
MADNFFEQLKSFYNKKPMNYDDMSPYLTLLWISHDKESLQYVENISKYLYIIKPQHMFKYLYYKLPYSKNKYLKWTKKLKLDDDEMITELCNQYGISKYEAKLYIE